VPLLLQRPAGLLDAVGALLGPTGWRDLSQDDLDLFVRATGDPRWTRHGPDPGAGSSFATDSMEGYLVLSIAGMFVPQLLHVEHCSSVINYGLDGAQFSAVPIPAALRARGTIVSAHPFGGGVQIGIEVTIEDHGASRPACVVTSVLRYLD
jgi:acyl dehydratase